MRRLCWEFWVARRLLSVMAGESAMVQEVIDIWIGGIVRVGFVEY